MVVSLFEDYFFLNTFYSKNILKGFQSLSSFACFFETLVWKFIFSWNSKEIENFFASKYPQDVWR